MKNGLVCRSTGSWYEVLDEDKIMWSCRIRGKFKLNNLKMTNPIAVGDHVKFEVLEDNTGLIKVIEERENYIIRRSIKNKNEGHIIASNLDLVLVIVTLNKPKTSLGFIDRVLVTAESFRIPSIIVFNKKDIYTVEEFEEQQFLATMYRSIGYDSILISATTDKTLDEFLKLIENKTCLVAGHSGVGKSTILNRLDNEIDQSTAAVSDFANKGVHTTTFAEMFHLKNGARIVDTPGIKELGLMNIEKEELAHFFPEMRALMNDCRFNNCMHLHEPGCAVLQALESKEISPYRYKSYLSMLENDDNRR